MTLLPDKIERKTLWALLLSLPLGIILYFILYMLRFIYEPPINPEITTFLISVLDGLIVWFILKSFGILPKVIIVFFSVLLGFIVVLIYGVIAHDFAMWKICYPEIRKQPLGIQNELGRDEVTRNYYQHKECENNILPFPWGKKAKFSDNPSGFIPK